MSEPELREIQRTARRQHMTVAEWVRQALRAAKRLEPAANTHKQLQAVRAAARHAFPTADIGAMLAEIEQGYLRDGAT